MQQIVSLPEDPVEVRAATATWWAPPPSSSTRATSGRAVQMFELARRLAAEKKLEPASLEPIQKKGHEELDPARLRQYMDRPERPQQLQEVMDFFERGLGAEQLLGQLEVEERRERRRLLLDLLVVHGEKARALASARLQSPGGGQRLRAGATGSTCCATCRAPPAAGDGEIEAVARCAGARAARPSWSRRRSPTSGQTRDRAHGGGADGAARAWEAELERPGHRRGGREDGPPRSTGSRPHSPARAGRWGWRALVGHALSSGRSSGTRPRASAELGSQDLVARRRTSSRRSWRSARRPAARWRAEAAGVAPGPGAAALVGGARGHAHARRRCAARGGGSASVAGGRRGGGARAGGPACGPGAAAALAPLGRARRLQPARSAPPPRPGQGLRHAEPAARRGRGAPATDRLLAGRLSSARCAHREGRAAHLPAVRAAVPGRVRVRAGGARRRTQPRSRRSASCPGGRAPLAPGGDTSALVPEELPARGHGRGSGRGRGRGRSTSSSSAVWEKACGQVTLRQMESELAADAFRILRPLAQWLGGGRAALRRSSARPGGLSALLHSRLTSVLQRAPSKPGPCTSAP